MKRQLIIFVSFNLVVTVIAAFFCAPTVGSLRNGRASVRMQERVFSAESGMLAELEVNLRELEEIRSGILHYNDMLPVLDEISGLVAAYELRGLELSTSEISDADFGDSVLYEMRVRAEYEGDFFNLVSFLRDFTGGYGNTRSFYFSDIMEESARLRLEFSLIGS
ncbi:MAG: hypothetical protein LBI27_09160 [Clostridiales bacterium]|jgi:hypothetical protein|nr:hypothetical protein [Clostridiales bacterium]